MKKILFILTLLLTTVVCLSQQTSVVARRVEARDSIKISDRWINDVDDDTTLMNGQTRELSTSNAIYDFVVGRHNTLFSALLDTAQQIRDDIAGGASVTDGDKGDITVIASGLTWTIDDDVVTYAKMQNVTATNRFMGRFSTGSGNMEEMTPTVATAMLDLFTNSLKGLVPGSGGGTTNFLRADGTWAVPPGGGGGGGTYTVSNLGGGLDNYSTQVGNDFRFNTFNSSDFDLASNLISIDYTNGQKVTHSIPGFATAVQATRWDSVTFFRNTGATGEGILTEITPGYLLGFKKFIPGTGIDFDVADSSITINSSGGPGGGRFGYPGEDETTDDDRSFDLDGFGLDIVNNQGGGAFTLNIGDQGIAGDNNQYILTDPSSYIKIGSLSIVGDAFTQYIAATVVTSSDVGKYTFTNIQEFADNSAATGGGLTTGMIYRTGDALKIVH